MGWNEVFATHYKPDGSINKKVELDSMYCWENEAYYHKVIKSGFYGSTYYAAVRRLDKLTREESILAVVCLVRTRGSVLVVKDMDESMGPVYYDCPKSILELLTPTDNENANEWRRMCWNRKAQPKLSDLGIGTKIRLEDGTVLIHRAPAYQFKRDWWQVDDQIRYYPKTRIRKFEVIE